MRKLFLTLLLSFITASGLVPHSQVASGSHQKIVTAAQVNGTWKSKASVLKIWALGQQRLRIEFDGLYLYDSPEGLMANTGNISGVAKIEGTTAIFESEKGGDEKCKLIMRFTKGTLVVEEEGTCGFGLNVTATGTYRRASRAKPKFDKN